jgi:hypothetical protein
MPGEWRSVQALINAGAALVLGCACMSAAEQPDRNLLPTAVLAREIQSLQGPSDGTNIDARSPATLVANMRRDVGNFIVRQIEADPAIAECDLQKQLAAAFAIDEDGCSGQSRDDGAPRVFAEPWGPASTRRIYVITYLWFGFLGKGGSETVLESYVWERDRGVHRGAGIVPASFSGLLTQTENVCWFSGPDKFPDTYWLLVSGVMGGGSGHVIAGSAAVFEIGSEGANAIWNAPQDIGNVKAYVPPHSLRWKIEYTDANRFYGVLPHATLLDVYQVDFAKQTFRRIVHQPLD